MKLIELLVITTAVMIVSVFLHEFMKWMISMMGFPLNIPFFIVFILVGWFTLMFGLVGKK